MSIYWRDRTFIVVCLNCGYPRQKCICALSEQDQNIEVKEGCYNDMPRNVGDN